LRVALRRFRRGRLRGRSGGGLWSVEGVGVWLVWQRLEEAHGWSYWRCV
jgi:hypothetical protein